MNEKIIAKAIVEGLVPYLVGSRNETKSLGETLKTILGEVKKKGEYEYEVEIDDNLREKLKGKDGYIPEKGKDYFTDDEINEIVERITTLVTPVIGEDYYTEEDKQALVEEILGAIEVPKGEPGKQGKPGKTPRKGEDYFTEEDINNIADVVTELVLEKLPKPKKITGKDLIKELRKLPTKDGIQIKDIYGLARVLSSIAGTPISGNGDDITGDKNFIQNFTASSVVTVTHNLNKYPAVNVKDSGGDQVEGDVLYNGLNEVVITFSSSFTGVVICN